MHEVVARRVREREERIDIARRYAAELSRRLAVQRIAVAGSVARGDFNVWSDIDVVIVAEELPARAADRAALLLEGAPAWLQPIGFTPGEYRRELARGNPLVVEADEIGVGVWDGAAPTEPGEV